MNQALVGSDLGDGNSNPTGLGWWVGIEDCW